MNRVQTRAQQARHDRRLNRLLMAAFALLLLAGLFSQITMLSRISAQAKQSQALETSIKELNYMTENYELGISQFHSHERVATRAAELGMIKPDESQIRVINLPVARGNTSTQSASNVGAEEIDH